MKYKYLFSDDVALPLKKELTIASQDDFEDALLYGNSTRLHVLSRDNHYIACIECAPIFDKISKGTTNPLSKAKILLLHEKYLFGRVFNLGALASLVFGALMFSMWNIVPWNAVDLTLPQGMGWGLVLVLCIFFAGCCVLLLSILGWMTFDHLLYLRRKSWLIRKVLEKIN